MGLIYDIGRLLFTGARNNSDDEDYDGSKNRSIKLQGKMDSISKMAKSAIFEYPVLMSESVAGSDSNLVYAICSYLENQYSIWSLIAMGMDPVFKGTDPKTHLAKFYSEESDIDNAYIAFIDRSNNTGIGKISMSLEDLTPYKISLEDGIKSQSTSIKGVKTTKSVKTDAIWNEQKQEYETKHQINSDITEVTSGVSAELAKLEKKIRSTDPTVVNVEFKMAENQHTVSFPVAVKAMPRFISSEESTRVFGYLREDKPIVMLIKLFSGEVGLFKDIIFQLERAKKDKDLYAKLGRHPWFRAMMEKKTHRKVNGLIQLIPALNSFIGGKETDILPICSLCVTKEEIESGFGNLWANIKKSDDSIMDKLMLMCLCVVDTNTNMVEFDFYGLKNNMIFRAEDLIKDYSSGSDKEKSEDINKLLQSLIYKV